MGRKTFLALLILCGILSQAIGTSVEEGKSLDLHSRKKRLVNNHRNENNPVEIQQVPYIVNIHRNGTSYCGGSILSSVTILSSASCFVDFHAEYQIISASNHKTNGTTHKLLRKILHPQWNFRIHAYDLVLLVIFPSIDLVRGPNRGIKIYDRHLPNFSIGTFSGWGCHKVIWGARLRPDHLRTAAIPIISRQECQRLYGKRAQILRTHLCTYDRTGHIGSCNGDDGGPLVVLDQQVGVLARNRMYFNPKGPALPDIFIDLSDFHIRRWIKSNVQFVY